MTHHTALRRRMASLLASGVLSTLGLACTTSVAVVFAFPAPVPAAVASASPDSWRDQLRKFQERIAGGELSRSCVPEKAISLKMRVAYRILSRSRGCVPRALFRAPSGGIGAVQAWAYGARLRGVAWCLTNTLTPAAPVGAALGLVAASRHCGKHAWFWVTWPGDVR